MGLRTALGLKAKKKQVVEVEVVPEAPPDIYIRPAIYAEPEDINIAFGARFGGRADIPKLLAPGSVGVELGVAAGGFSSQLLRSDAFGHLYSIDRWAGDRDHNVWEYKAAIRALQPYRDRNSCLRMTFDEALDLFPDCFFDLVYIDGYAHTGQDDGKTLTEWWPKLKWGGVFAGDDYSQSWPKTMRAVDEFMYRNNLKCYTVPKDEKHEFESWLTIKPPQNEPLGQ